MYSWDLAQSAAGRALYHDPKNKKARFRRAMARKHLKRYYGAKLGELLGPIMCLTFRKLCS